MRGVNFDHGRYLIGEIQTDNSRSQKECSIACKYMHLEREGRWVVFVRIEENASVSFFSLTNC